MSEVKLAWQRKQRREFKRTRGYSTNAHYATAGLREAVLDRDGHACVACGLTEVEHLLRWGRPITVDHINKNRAENTMANLQVLCLPCHGRKDITPALTVSKVEPIKAQILGMRAMGTTYQAIADAHGLSIGAVWKAIQRWETRA